MTVVQGSESSDCVKNWFTGWELAGWWLYCKKGWSGPWHQLYTKLQRSHIYIWCDKGYHPPSPMIPDYSIHWTTIRVTRENQVVTGDFLFSFLRIIGKSIFNKWDIRIDWWVLEELVGKFTFEKLPLDRARLDVTWFQAVDSYLPYKHESGFNLLI